jgi:hypothetical protein
VRYESEAYAAYAIVGLYFCSVIVAAVVSARLRRPGEAPWVSWVRAVVVGAAFAALAVLIGSLSGG